MVYPGSKWKDSLFREFADQLKSGPDIFLGKLIFLPHLFKGHAASQADDDERNRHPHATNDGFAVANGRVNDNAVIRMVCNRPLN